jgi:hypothetical protein
MTSNSVGEHSADSASGTSGCPRYREASYSKVQSPGSGRPRSACDQRHARSVVDVGDQGLQVWDAWMLASLQTANEALQAQSDALQYQLELQAKLLEAREVIERQGEVIERQMRMAAQQPAATTEAPGTQALGHHPIQGLVHQLQQDPEFLQREP